MSNVLLIIQLIISIILTGLILIQRSEGGALGIGGGGGGGLMSGRSATTSIARMTAILGTLFLLNCLVLSVVYKIENNDTLIIDDEALATQPVSPPSTASAVSNESTPDLEETAAEALTPTVDSSEGTIPLAEETPAEEADPEEDE